MTYKIYEVSRSVKLNKYLKYDAYLLERAIDIRQTSMDHEIYKIGQGLETTLTLQR